MNVQIFSAACLALWFSMFLRFGAMSEPLLTTDRSSCNRLGVQAILEIILELGQIESDRSSSWPTLRR